MDTTSDHQRILQILHPFARERQSYVRSQNRRFVHYTSADAAMRMIRNQEVWMRNASCMNDFREVDYGLECLKISYHSDTGKEFQSLLNSMFDEISKEIQELFDGWLPYFQSETYLTCISEHLKEEDGYGRLSMWRAYGDTRCVALVLNCAPFISDSDALKAYTSPVAYFDKVAFHSEFSRIVKGVEGQV